jgi:hypothetical protein
MPGVDTTKSQCCSNPLVKAKSTQRLIPWQIIGGRITKRHPKLILRTIKGIDKDKALDLQLAIVTKFYANLSKSCKDHSYGPHKIWNYDESGLHARRDFGM